MRYELAQLGCGMDISVGQIGRAPTFPPKYEGERGVIALWDALVPLQSVNSFLETGAHPDDETSGLLAYMAKRVGARTAFALATRGEGGQNAIGTEYLDALGVLRTNEITQAAAVLNSEVWVMSRGFGDSITDFGYSKTAEETFSIWGKDVALDRLVRIIRAFRPDVVLNGHTDSGHGHHRAMYYLTKEAVRAAADANAFPEHFTEGLRPWEVKKYYEFAAGNQPVTVSIPIGEFSPIHGMSFNQIGQMSRNYHLSQGMDTGPSVAGVTTINLTRVSSVVPAPAKEESVFDGLPKTVGDLANLVTNAPLRSALLQVQTYIEAALRAYPDHVQVLSAVQRALAEVRHARRILAGIVNLDDELKFDLDWRLAIKEEQLQKASKVASQLVTTLTASQYELSPGASATFAFRAFCGGQIALRELTLDLVAPEGWSIEVQKAVIGVELNHNETVEAVFKVTVPTNASFYSPYKEHIVPHGFDSPVYGVVRYTVHGVPVEIRVGPQKTVAVVPELSIRVSPSGTIYNLARPRPLKVTAALTSFRDDPISTTVSVRAPEGWQVDPENIFLSFDRRGDTRSVEFVVVPPDKLELGRYELRVVAAGAAKSEHWVQIIEYPHVGRTYLIQPATCTVVTTAVVFPENLRVGYVASGFDKVDKHLSNLGIQVDLLDTEALTTGDLSKYDAIVLGVRAYRTRLDAAVANARLLEYVRNGGTLVVQYHQSDPGDNWDPERPPYRLVIGSPSAAWRVTDENAKVTYLVPEHPLLNHPNKIVDADWCGWKKERGLYFASEWAPEYVALLSMRDPGEQPLTGSLLVANYGKGRYIYVALTLYYQMDNLVPGAFRLFANLISPPQ